MSQRVETITTKQILALLEKQAYRCALTGWTLTPETASIDHVTPLAKGGDHAIENAQIVDWRVNQAKGQMTNEEFVEMCRAVTHSPKVDIDKAALRATPADASLTDEERVNLQRQLVGMERRLRQTPDDEHLMKSRDGVKRRLESDGATVEDETGTLFVADA